MKMPHLTKKKNGRSYIIQSSLGVGVWAVLSTIVTGRVFSAPQLSLLTKIAICSFLWGIFVCMTIVFIRYYRKLQDE
jgi:hypothetical protein